MIKYWLVLSFCFVWTAIAYSQELSANTPRILLERIGKTPPDTNRVKLLVDLGSYYVLKRGYFKTDKDSALVYFDEARELSIVLHSKKWENETLLQKGYCYLLLDDFDRGSAFFMKVIDFYRDQKNKPEEARTWERFGYAVSRNPVMLEKKVYCYQHARQLYKQLNDRVAEIQDFKNIADAHMIEGKYDLAESELLEVIRQFKSINYKDLHYTYDLLASLNRMKGDLHQELFYKIEVVNSMESTGDFSHATYFYYNLATTYYDLGLYRNSLIYYNKALPFSIKEQNYDRFYELLRDIVQVLILEHKADQALQFLLKETSAIPAVNLKQREWMDAAFGSCYQELKMVNKADRYYLDMIKLADVDYKNKGYEDYFHNYSIVSNFFVATERYKKANYYLSKILNAPPNLMRPSLMSQIQLLQFKVDSASGRLISAIRHFEMHKKLNDSLFNATNKKLLDEVQLRYESEKKDRDLLLQKKNIQLLTKQSQLEQNQVDRTKAIKNVFLGAFFMAIVLLGLIYNRYRLKQRSIKLLTEKQIEIANKNASLQQLAMDNEWLVKEVHHRVKNNLHIIISLLQSQSTFLKDEVALNAVMDSQHRIHAISLIHQKLYKAELGTTIYMPEYINELVEYLKQSFTVGQSILFSQRIEPVYIDVGIAVPLGLILNEVITNSIKYAFLPEQEGQITIKLTCPDNSIAHLIILDTGRGLPNGFDIEKSNSFGMTLVRGLIENDLGGTYEIVNHGGTTFLINFEINPVA
jgi:two-component system, sensor histidine kinase PdtaS